LQVNHLLFEHFQVVILITLLVNARGFLFVVVVLVNSDEAVENALEEVDAVFIIFVELILLI